MDREEPSLISKCGSLEMTFKYNPAKGKMAITIHQAQDIPSKERGGASSTQVRILLLPTKKQRYKTKVKTGENPVFNENFVFNKIPQGMELLLINLHLIFCQNLPVLIFMNIEKMEIQVLLFFYIYVYIFWILRELSKIMKLSM